MADRLPAGLTVQISRSTAHYWQKGRKPTTDISRRVILRLQLWKARHAYLFVSPGSLNTTGWWVDRNIHGRKPQFGLEREHVSTALRPGYLQFTNLAYARSVTEPSHLATMVVKLWAVLVSLEAFTLFPCYRSLGYTSNSTFPALYGRSSRVVR